MTKGEMELNVAIGANWHGAKWERANRDVTIERARQTGLGGRGGCGLMAVTTLTKATVLRYLRF